MTSSGNVNTLPSETESVAAEAPPPARYPRSESRSWLQYPASRLQRLLRDACPRPAHAHATLRLRTESNMALANLSSRRCQQPRSDVHILPADVTPNLMAQP
ncbi:unnamed protein product [Euphydryas editha]|uniref:Uncharacterized protein n=1 Tax=Euphydryas editha TaxID=104508 RepID=A0AAU9VED1_EUPED|nr:unnamed protein product [Euphydryas editha]